MRNKCSGMIWGGGGVGEQYSYSSFRYLTTSLLRYVFICLICYVVPTNFSRRCPSVPSLLSALFIYF